MALKVTINAEGGGIVIQNVGKANELYLVGLEDIRLSQKDATDIQVELENPEHLIQTVLDTSAGEVSINGNVSASPAAAIADFGAVVEAARSAGGGGGGDATAANQVTQIGLETSIKTNTDSLNVNLSTRATEVTMSAANQNLSSIKDQLDEKTSTRASETTAAGIKTGTDKIPSDPSTVTKQNETITAINSLSLGANKGNTGAITTVGNSAASVTLKVANASRKSITIVNRSNKNLAVAFSATATISAFTYWLPKRGGDIYSTVTINEYTGVISGIWSDSGDEGATITETTQV